VILSDCGPERSVQVAERLRAAVAGAAAARTLTASAGVASYPADANDLETLIGLLGSSRGPSSRRILGCSPLSTGRTESVVPTPEEDAMGTEADDVTGTADKDYNIIWFTEACLSNALRLETYIQDADQGGDTELAEFFRKAKADSRKGGEQGKALLTSRWTR